MAATSQIEIETTLPCLNHLPLPGSYKDIFYRPFLLEDLQAYNTFSNQSLTQCGQKNPHFEMSNTHDRFQRILESCFTQGIHLGFFFKRKNQNEFELIAEGGVYMSESSWPSLYWTHLNKEIDGLKKNWTIEIPYRIQQFWWSIPRKFARLRVDLDSLLKDTQGRLSSIEMLCFHGEPSDSIDRNLKEYKKSHWRSWSSLLVKTTTPSFENISNLTPSSDRLILRQLTPEDADAFYSVKNPEKATQLDFQNIRRYLKEVSSLSPSSTYFMKLLGIFLKEDNKEQEMIGYLEVGLREYEGWPYISYILKEEYRGKKYGTEFLKTFITYWSSLPRKQIQLLIDPSRLDYQSVHEATERIYARVPRNNLGSQGILRNNGFKEVSFKSDDTFGHWVFMMDF